MCTSVKVAIFWQYLIQEDLGPPSNYHCSSDNRYGPKQVSSDSFCSILSKAVHVFYCQQFLVPAGAGNCSDTHSHAQVRLILW